MVICGLWAAGPDLGGAGPQASHQQGVSHQTPQFLKPCNSTAYPFLKSQIRHWTQASHQGPQASHQLNPALLGRMFHIVVSYSEFICPNQEWWKCS